MTTGDRLPAFHRAAIVLATLLVAACSTPPTPFQPGKPLNTYGYSQEQIDLDTWRISFSGNSATDRGTVEDYMLYRAAEITVDTGNDGFVILQDSVEKDTAYRGTTSYPYSPFFYGGFAYGGYRRPYYGGFGAGYGYTNLTPINSYTAYARIRVFSDVAPEGVGQAYDANAILRVLGRKIIRPVEEG